MKTSTYLSTRDGAIAENKISRIVIAALTGIILILSVAIAAKSTTVVMVPPTLEESSSVGATEASKETQIAWGMYLVGLLGNVTPKSAETLRENVSRHLTPRLYNSIGEGIDAQVKEIREEQVTLSFSPTVARWDAETGNVIVTGELTIRGLRGQEKRELRTYELGFVTRNYNVMLDSMRVLQGAYQKEASVAGEEK